MANSLGGYSQTGPRGPDFYQLTEPDSPTINLAVEKEPKVKKPKLPPVGSGARFKALASSLSKEKGVTDPDALAASIGRQKFGRKAFQAMAAKGRKNKES